METIPIVLPGPPVDFHGRNIWAPVFGAVDFKLHTDNKGTGVSGSVAEGRFWARSGPVVFWLPFQKLPSKTKSSHFSGVELQGTRGKKTRHNLGLAQPLLEDGITRELKKAACGLADLFQNNTGLPSDPHSTLKS